MLFSGISLFLSQALLSAPVSSALHQVICADFCRPLPRWVQASPAEVAGIWRELPWLKLVVSMREPISQKMSSIVHWGGKQTPLARESARESA